MINPVTSIQAPKKTTAEDIDEHLLNQISEMIAKIELRIYTRIGKTVRPTNNLSGVRTYFNKSAANCALAALFCKNYYAKELMTKSQVAWHLGISRNASSDKIDHCVKHGYFLKSGMKYGAAPLFMRAYLEYVAQESEWIKSKMDDLSSFVTVYTDQKNAK